MTVLLAYLVVSLPVPARFLAQARVPALYVVGIVAAYWSWLRVVAIAS